MGCFVVAEFLLTSASRGPSAIAEPLVVHIIAKKRVFHMLASAISENSSVPFRSKVSSYTLQNLSDFICVPPIRINSQVVVVCFVTPSSYFVTYYFTYVPVLSYSY